MTLVRFEPWTVMDRLNRQMSHLFGDAATGASEEQHTWTPAVDVIEEADKFIVRADLPGVDAKDIQITAEKGVLTLSGERTASAGNDQASARFERASGKFLRRFTLPESVQADNIRARQVNGVLELTLPKQPTVEPRRVTIETH